MAPDVCGDDHPQIAYAASTRAESISIVSTERHHIAAWRAEVESEESEGTFIANVENLTLTELKCRISRLLRDNEEHEARRVTAAAAVAAVSGEATMEQESEIQKRAVEGP
jgi:hypothetical protein